MMKWFSPFPDDWRTGATFVHDWVAIGLFISVTIHIAKAVSDYYGVPMDALQGQKRDKAIVVPRQIAMFLMREETDVSLLRIGAELGGRDHSTVLHACDKITREASQNDELRREIAAVRELIYAD